MIHTGLIKLNGVKVVLQDELKDASIKLTEFQNDLKTYIGLRSVVTEKQRPKLEDRIYKCEGNVNYFTKLIATKKVMIENLCNIDLDFRQEL